MVRIIFLIISIFTALLGFYTWISLQKMEDFPKLQLATKTLFITESLILIFVLFWLFFIQKSTFTIPRSGFIGFVLMMVPLSFLLFSTFLLLEDLLFLGQFIFQKIKVFFNPHSNENVKISRAEFLLQMGFWVSTVPIVAALVSAQQAHAYKIHRIKITSKKIPKNFENFKIIQISDIHVGSLWNAKAVAQGIEKILAEKPDLILFTGDLVNNDFSELNEEYQAIFSRLKANLGIYSVLGNHDYGDYRLFPNQEAKAENFKKIQELHTKMGWNLLKNSSIILEKNSEKISLIGVENWGLHGFTQYGNLTKAYENIDKNSFQILMSHDPSHWRAEVLENFPNIDLTLSGHTHGFQAGIETPFFRFSPIQFRYPEWAGLYQEKQQFLYVNRGFGYIGFPGRIGILPEITVFTLKNAENHTESMEEI